MHTRGSKHRRGRAKLEVARASQPTQAGEGSSPEAHLRTPRSESKVGEPKLHKRSQQCFLERTLSKGERLQ